MKTKQSLKIDIRKPQEAEGRPEVQNKLVKSVKNVKLVCLK